MMSVIHITLNVRIKRDTITSNITERQTNYKNPYCEYDNNKKDNFGSSEIASVSLGHGSSSSHGAPEYTVVSGEDDEDREGEGGRDVESKVR